MAFDMSEDSHILTMIVDRLQHIETRLTSSEHSAGESRRRMHDKLETHGELLLKIDHRVTMVEKAVDSAAPTLKEYADMKSKVAGAGLLGKSLWKFGRWILAGAVAAYALRNDLAAWWHWLVSR